MFLINVYGSSKFACPISEYMLEEVLYKNKYLTCVVLVLIRAFFAFAGGKCIIPTEVIIGGVFFTLIILLIVFNLFTLFTITSTTIVWIIMYHF